MLAAKGRILAEATLRRCAATLELEVFGPTSRQLRTQASALVCFTDDQTAYSFFARIVAYHRPTLDGPALLEVELPEYLLGLEAPPRRVTRHSFRVPLLDDEELTVEVTFEGLQAAVARVVDLSLGGMLLELTVAPPRELAVGSPLHVRLDHGDVQLAEWAEVRTLTDDELGVCFPSFGDGPKLDPPPAYARLAARLERNWLRQRPGK